jgi:hypothetical protein
MLSDVIARFATHATLTVTRTAASTFSYGVKVPGSTSTITLTKPCVQPVSGREIRALPEGMSADDVRLLFTTTPLLASAGHPDTVVIDGDTYAVFRVDDKWKIGSSVHYRAWCVRQTTP